MKNPHNLGTTHTYEHAFIRRRGCTRQGAVGSWAHEGCALRNASLANAEMARFTARRMLPPLFPIRALLARSSRHSEWGWWVTTLLQLGAMNPLPIQCGLSSELRLPCLQSAMTTAHMKVHILECGAMYLDHNGERKARDTPSFSHTRPWFPTREQTLPQAIVNPLVRKLALWPMCEKLLAQGSPHFCRCRRNARTPRLLMMCTT